MMHFGSPDEWLTLIETQVPRIIQLVIEVWEALPPPAANELENHVTNLICARLQNHPERHTFPFHIQPQDVLLEPDSGVELGRTDIAFKPFVPSDSVYFCLECKRINVREQTGGPPRQYFAEYVRFGMLRFIRGQYAHTVRHGGMLGFVLNGDVPAAIAGVEENIRRRHADLGMQTPGGFQPSTARPTDPRIRETRHARVTHPDPFHIHHLFMAGDPESPLRPDQPTDPNKVKEKRKKTSRRKPAK